MVTVRMPATEPAKLIVPSSGAFTVEPSAAAKSTPQWPAYAPWGANAAVCAPGTGAIRHASPTAIHIGLRLRLAPLAERTGCRFSREGGRDNPAIGTTVDG